MPVLNLYIICGCTQVTATSACMVSGCYRGFMLLLGPQRSAFFCKHVYNFLVARLAGTQMLGSAQFQGALVLPWP